MKMKAVFIALLLIAGVSQLQAQHVRVRMNFPGSIRAGAPGPSPFRGAIWIGPEWRWQQNQYVSVPGYWARPKHQQAVWIPGHWQNSRRGYKWVPGHWR